MLDRNAEKTKKFNSMVFDTKVPLHETTRSLSTTQQHQKQAKSLRKQQIRNHPLTMASLMDMKETRTSQILMQTLEKEDIPETNPKQDGTHAISTTFDTKQEEFVIRT